MSSTLRRIAEALAGEIILARLLPQIVSAAREVTGAQYGALGVVAEHTDLLTQFIHQGMDAELVRRIGPTPTGGGLLGELIRRPHLIITDDLNQHPAARGFPEGHPPMTTFLGLPVRAGGRVFGNIYLTDKAGGFDQADADVVTVLAAQAGLAINAAQMAEELRMVAVQDERDRISRDLHDGVIQQLFSIGMSLEGARPIVRTDPDRIEERLDAAVDQLDATIKEIRTTIFTLRPGRTQEVALERGIIELAREYEQSASFTPSVQMSTALDQTVPTEVVPDVLHIVREALSNAAKHSMAKIVELRAEVEGDDLVVVIADGGTGFDPDTMTPGHGLGNMAERAAILGATLRMTSTPGEGTTVDLRVPLRVEDTPQREADR